LTALADAEKVDVRRYCGYPAYGAAPEGMQSWRFFQVYGVLEYRIANLSDIEVGIVRQYIAALSTLELAIPASAANLDTDEASVWTRNKMEVGDRLEIFDEWRRRLCGFIGIPVGPSLSASNLTLIV
jgi:hypothetical protein